MNFDTIKTLIVLAVVAPAALVIVWALASSSWRKSGVDQPWSSLSKLFHWTIAGSVMVASIRAFGIRFLSGFAPDLW